MEIIQVLSAPPSGSHGMVLCIGKFDGLHVGHQALLRVARQYADTNQLAVMSFAPHPLWALKSDADFRHSLTPASERRRLLEQHGVARVYEVNFTKEYAQTSPQTFVLEHLASLNLKRVVVGEGFNFGKGAHSTTQELIDLCKEIDVPVTVVPTINVNGRKVSSTDIRRHIQTGRVEAAQGLLGRAYTVTGKVVHGAGVGHELGFPTANLGDIEEYVVPASGVYEGIVEVHNGLPDGNEFWYALISAGYRPTVNGTSYEIEAYLLNYHGDLYGKVISVSFIHRARDEIKFSGIDALKIQMHQDEATSKHRFGIYEI